ncbi:hypothetical protein Thiowin_04109 [Thiorhodovibrio winogradskyi]|uniref:Uncharacterized protein n=1 Tax=Thiorhodovibrio winogradskyi TaxID=77007 RepID=A0ABZ0SF56_9GAMM|nr:hypothetical protein [Thiorhodovibrio winogradskyi]
MQPRFCIDLALRSSSRLPLPAAASKALKVLHDGFQQRPGHYALALPNAPERALSRLRVFAGSALELESLAFRARLPYFELQSASTRQAFRLIVEPIAAEGPITAAPEPDGFGLSVTTRPFALPSALRLSG